MEFYAITEKIKQVLEEDPFVTTVLYGTYNNDTKFKRNIYPVSQFVIETAEIGTNTITFSFLLLCMDIIDQNNEDNLDKFLLNDNQHDILNTQLAVVNRFCQRLMRGDVFSEAIQIDINPTATPFTMRFSDLCAGWALSFDVKVRNEMTIC